MFIETFDVYTLLNFINFYFDVSTFASLFEKFSTHILIAISFFSFLNITLKSILKAFEIYLGEKQ